MAKEPKKLTVAEAVKILRASIANLAEAGADDETIEEALVEVTENVAGRTVNTDDYDAEDEE